MNAPCPLCYSDNTTIFHENSKRIYLECQVCNLVFVPKKYHLCAEQEKQIYDQHQNNPFDSGYRKFLNKLAIPLINHLEALKFSHKAKGLDFGSGPGPTLSLMLKEHGYDMSIYDHFYARDPSVLNQQYDFVTSTEVWEHLSEPGKIIDSLFRLGNEKFLLGVMTKRIPKTEFSKWHYINDSTHITFYSDKTLMYIADKYSCRLELPESDTAIFIRA